MNKNQFFAIMTHLVEGLGKALGEKTEVVLHDLSQPESSIIAIANNNVTGRKVGDSTTNLGLPVLKNPYGDYDLFNYRSYTKSGKLLKSSSIYFKDEEGKVFAALCINQDISELEIAINILKKMISTNSGVNEEYVSNIDDLISQLIDEAISSINIPINMMSKEDKMKVLQKLDEKGVFMVKRSIDRVANLLGISRVTAYGYLSEIQASKDQNQNII